MDEATFDALYEESFERQVRQVTAMCGSAAEAQDCVQEAFIRAWDHRRQLSPDGHPEAWVRTTAQRLAISRWRRTTKFLRATDRSVLPDPPAQPSPDRIAIERALKRLPAEQREAIVLFHMGDLSIADIAAETGRPVGTIKARLSRARAALATYLTDALPEEASHA